MGLALILFTRPRPGGVEILKHMKKFTFNLTADQYNTLADILLEAAIELKESQLRALSPKMKRKHGSRYSLLTNFLKSFNDQIIKHNETEKTKKTN
jgi:hemoglobin-like flavoprotein